MKELILVAGTNGAGKTSFAKDLCRENGYPFLNADEIARALPAGSERSNNLRAGRLFLQEMQQLVRNHQSFVAESTLAGNYLASRLQAYRDQYHITIVYVFLSEPYTYINRIAHRVKEGGHFVAAADVLRRYVRSKQQFWHTYRYLCDHWQLINNDEGFLPVASGKEEQYTVVDNGLFDQFLSDI